MTEKNSEVVAENVSAKVLETAGGDCRELSIKLDNASENNGRAAGGEHRRPVTCLDKPATTGADREVVARVIAGFGFEREPVERALEQLYMTKPAAPVADVLLTSRELQVQLKISSTTLWRAGELPHVKIGARRRYILREVLEHLAQRQHRGVGGKIEKGGRRVHA